MALNLTLPLYLQPPFKENRTVYLEQCLYLQCCALPPPLSINTGFMYITKVLNVTSVGPYVLKYSLIKDKSIFN